MQERTSFIRLVRASVLLGLGLGGFFDGIVLHQLLQWHHMLSSEGRWPVTTVAGLKANTLGDGLFHAATYLATLLGLWLLWRAIPELPAPPPGSLLAGLLLMGWGAFNLVEGVIDHVLLGLHQVREDSAHQGMWDLAFLIWGAAMLLGGWSLARSGERAIDDRGQHERVGR